jgi:oligopeptidase B
MYDYVFESSELTRIGPVSSDEETYTRERVFVSSTDGTRVPLSSIYRKDKKSWSSLFGVSDDSNRPVVLVGYGAYGEPMNLGCDPSWLPLLERGYVIAFAHTRGGGDLGKDWYHGGRRENKTKSIEDYEVCASYLKDRWGGKLTAKAFSAGGVLVGAAVNRQPSLFDNVVLINAFLDVYATLTNSELFLTPHEWDEYGNPLEDAEIDRLIKSYCPVSNMRTNESAPRTLVIGTVDDENVPYWNAAIFAKKLRDFVDDKDKVFLHIEDGGKHQLGSRRLQVAALELAFILQDHNK